MNFRARDKKAHYSVSHKKGDSVKVACERAVRVSSKRSGATGRARGGHEGRSHARGQEEQD